MGTVTVSVRLPESEAGRMELAAREMGVDRSTFLTLAARRGAQALKLEHACGAYRNGQVTLSRAAEMADLSVRAMMLELQRHGLELNYGVNELEEDLQGRDFKRDPDDPEKTDRYQAEALIHRYLPVEHLAGIVCHGEKAMKQLERDLRVAHARIKVAAVPSCYF